MSDPWGLSPTEATVMRLMTSGQGSAEVAKDMGISIKTVQTYLRRINAKMGAKTALQSVLAWDRHLRPARVEPHGVPQRKPGKRDMAREKHREAARADQETRGDRANRILLAKLREAMPWWKEGAE